MINLRGRIRQVRYARSIMIQSIKFEKALRKIASAAIKEEYRFIINRVERGNLSTKLPNPPSKTFVSKLLFMYLNVARFFSNQVFEMARHTQKKDFGQTYIDTRMNFFKTLALNKANEISKTTKKNAIRIIKKGVKEGISGVEIAKELYQQTGIESFTRADKIARTEIHTIQNLSMFEAAKSEPDVFKYKKWLAANDDRTRQGHLEAEELGAILIDETFTVNIYDHKGDFVDSDEMDHPGDITASAANVIYCRCLLLFYTDEESAMAA